MTWSGMTLVRRHLVRHDLVRHDLVRHHVVRHDLVRHDLVRHRAGRDAEDDDDDERCRRREGVRGSGWAPSQRIMLLTATVAAAAVALFVIVVRTLPGAPTALTLPWVLWAAAFAAQRGAGRPRPVAARGAHASPWATSCWRPACSWPRRRSW